MKDLTLKEFCRVLSKTSGLSHAKKAISIMFFLSETTETDSFKIGDIVSIIRMQALGNPNSTQLMNLVSREHLTVRKDNTFKLKPNAEETIHKWLGDISIHKHSTIDHSRGYLSDAIWKNTRGYLEKICEQLNGCFDHGFFDAAAVLIRRITETLLIEAYESLQRESEIKDETGYYFLLSGLVEKAKRQDGLPLGRDSRSKHLLSLKELGDRSAHKRHYNANRSDLLKVQDGFRIITEELIGIAQIKRD